MHYTLSRLAFALSTLVFAPIYSMGTAYPPLQKAININSGTYELDTLLSDDVTIDGATITGRGIIMGDLNIENNGTVSASLIKGNQIGAITVNGNYRQSKDSTYLVHVSPIGTNDFVLVKNNALLGGTVEVKPIDGPIIAPDSHLIMRVEGDVAGAFNGVTSNDRSLLTNLSYVVENGHTDVFLNVDNVFTAAAKSGNEKGMGLFFATHDDKDDAYQALKNEVAVLASSPETSHQARAIYNQCSGYQLTSLVPLAELAVTQFIRRLYDPLRSIVTTEWPGPTNCWDPANFDPYTNLPRMMDFDGGACCPMVPPTLDIWFDIGGGRGHFNGNSCAKRLKVKDFQFTVGLQTTFLSNWTFGGAFSYAKQYLHYRFDGGGNVNNSFLGIYTLYKTRRWYFLADGVLGVNFGSSHRNIDTEETHFRSRSRPKIYEAFLYLEAGYDLPWRCLLFQPFLGLQTGVYNRNGIHESGDNPLNLDIMSSTPKSTSSRLGVHMTAPHFILCNLALSIDLAWQYRFSSVSTSVHGFILPSNDTFRAGGVDFGRNSYDAAVTLTTWIDDDWEIYGEAMVQGSSAYSAYDLLVGFKYRW